MFLLSVSIPLVSRANIPLQSVFFFLLEFCNSLETELHLISPSPQGTGVLLRYPD